MHVNPIWLKGRIESIRPLGHIGFTCIYTSLGSFCRPIWPDICCKFHPLRGLYNRGRGIYMGIYWYVHCEYDGDRYDINLPIHKSMSEVNVRQQKFISLESSNCQTGSNYMMDQLRPAFIFEPLFKI